MITTVILSLIIVVHLFYIIRYYRFSRKLSKTPYFNEALDGVYVKFYGEVKPENNLKSPGENIECEFYNFKATGLREVKRKAPASGYDTILKPLYREISNKPILLIDQNGKEVYVSTRITKQNSVVALKINKVLNRTSDWILEQKKEPLYNDFEYLTSFIKKDDKFTVYGKLVKQKNKFIISDTYNSKFPFIMFLGNFLSFGSFYKNNFINRFVSLILAIVSLSFIRYVSDWNLLMLIPVLIILYVGVLRFIKGFFFIFKSDLGLSYHEKEKKSSLWGISFMIIIGIVIAYWVAWENDYEGFDYDDYAPSYLSGSYYSSGLRGSGSSFRNRGFGSGK